MDAIFNVLKPPQMTSHDVIGFLRRVLNTKKIGHGGTLDPDAAGVLPVFAGSATRLLEFAVEGRKEYIAEFTLGAQTVTGDDSGEVVKTMPVPAFGKQELEAVLARFTGKQMQLPPMYSAIKINGKKLYQLARQGVEVERTARPIEVYKLELLHYTATSFTVRVACSKGTYIRTLLEDIAAAMGQKGTMSALRRVAAGVYSEADAHTLEEIQAAKDAGPEALQALMLPVESVFASLPLLVADERVEQHLYNGCPTSRYPAADGRYRVRNAGGQFLGLANVVNGVLKVEKLFVERN